MELQVHDEIIQAISDLHELRLTFRSKEDGGAILSRRCAPMDYGPSQRRNVRDKTPRYHFWDFESDSGSNHVLSLPASQITNVEVLNSSFEPSSFVTWSPMSWSVVRTTWGNFN